MMISACFFWATNQVTKLCSRFTTRTQTISRSARKMLLTLLPKQTPIGGQAATAVEKEGLLPSTQGMPYSEKPPTAGLGYDVPAYSSYQPPGSHQGPPPPGQAYSPYRGPQPIDSNASGHTRNPPKKGKLRGKFGDTMGRIRMAMALFTLTYLKMHI